MNENDFQELWEMYLEISSGHSQAVRDYKNACKLLLSLKRGGQISNGVFFLSFDYDEEKGYLSCADGCCDEVFGSIAYLLGFIKEDIEYWYVCFDN